MKQMNNLQSVKIAKKLLSLLKQSIKNGEVKNLWFEEPGVPNGEAFVQISKNIRVKRKYIQNFIDP